MILRRESHVRAVNAAEKSLSSFQAISHKVKVIMVFFLPSDGLIGSVVGDPVLKFTPPYRICKMCIILRDHKNVV